MLPLLSLLLHVTPCPPLFPLVTPCYHLLPLVTHATPCSPLFPLVPPCYSWLPLVTACYRLLPHVTSCSPLFPLVTPCTPRYPLFPLVTHGYPCYPLLPLVTLVTPYYPCYTCYPLLPFVTLCYHLIPLVSPCNPFYPTLKTQIESVFLDSHQSQLFDVSFCYEQIIDCLLLNRFSVGNTEHSLGKQGRIQGFLIGEAGGGGSNCWVRKDCWTFLRQITCLVLWQKCNACFIKKI